MSNAQNPIGAERPFESAETKRPVNPPNILFILADDLGWADLGCYGSTDIRTPHLDRLAAGGVRFTHAYAGSSWCSPTRMSLYTGRYPGRLAAGIEEPLRTREDGMGIPHEHPTLPSLLVEGGYQTAMFGKWHCGWLPWYSPLKAGFQRFFGCLDGAIDYFEHIATLGEADLWEDETPVEEVGYFTSMISARAAEYVGIERDEPFYVQLNYTAPHWPWEGPDDARVGARVRAEFDALDESEMAPLPLLDFHNGSLAKYAEMVEAMDTGIGEVLDALDAAGKTDDTIVCFCSDNGGERWSKNWPFVGEKGDLTEGGIRVPFILRWPDAVGGSQVSDRPQITMDWTSTLLDAAGVMPDPAYPLDGPSLLPWLVDGAEFPEHDLFWRTSSQAALRRGPFKYLRDRRPRPVISTWPVFEGEYELLYDVTVDGREAADVSPHRPELLAQMRAALAVLEQQMLPYPPDTPGLPRRASADGPAVSQPD